MSSYCLKFSSNHLLAALLVAAGSAEEPKLLLNFLHPLQDPCILLAQSGIF